MAAVLGSWTMAASVQLTCTTQCKSHKKASVVYLI
jgi:hypothetical protein